MRDYLTGAGVLLMAVAAFAVNSAVIGSATGVVREHCLDTDASNRAGAVEVESKWTYMLWPPGPLASVDPPGRCVRLSPLHEALSAVGVWKLSPATVQVRQHVLDQLRSRQPSAQL